MNEFAPPRQLRRWVVSRFRKQISARLVAQVCRAAQTLFVITWLGGKRLKHHPAPRLRVVVNGSAVARYNLGRPNKSLNRSGVSGLLIRETRMLLELDRRPVNSTVIALLFSRTTRELCQYGWVVIWLLARGHCFIRASNRSCLYDRGLMVTFGSTAGPRALRLGNENPLRCGAG